MGKSRRVWGDLYDDRGGDLSDVNELELAKEIRDMDEGEERLEERSEEINKGDEDDISLPVISSATEETKLTVSEDISDTDKSEAHEEEPKKANMNGEHINRPQNDPRHKSKRSKGGGLYVAVILFCLAAGLAILAFIMADRSGEPIITDNNTEDTADQAELTEDTDGKTVSSADQVYSSGMRSAVTVIARNDTDVKYSSGVVVFSDGYVATLCDTIKNSQSVDVVLWNGSTYSATVVGAHEVVDLALLKIDAELECVTVGDSSSLCTGDRIYAIGTVRSEKLASSLFAGEISYAARLLELTDPSGTELRVAAMQISELPVAELRGCPVFNESGEAIAMALITGEGAVSFALPMDKALNVLSAMRSGDEPSAEVLSSLAYTLPRLGIMGEQRCVDGAYGVAIMGFSTEDSDVARKLRTEDLIIAIGDTPITDTSALRSAVEKYKSGETVEIFVIRRGQRLSFYVELG